MTVSEAEFYRSVRRFVVFPLFDKFILKEEKRRRQRPGGIHESLVLIGFLLEHWRDLRFNHHHDGLILGQPGSRLSM
ncbi:protein of unknown function [Candidatus Filomicrobium marinum]|uniref:Uncharacterized protein n=1 Tax=Candidatus Filomicrobium marinum TaxID=1608628 RepID=A0A0D6JDM5_9HYPH|nr:protein of unknown function [Candidatus Filomicrobium marinum]CPR17457.1 protein of unknown function [Candidatus Filomicrobium marinum]